MTHGLTKIIKVTADDLKDVLRKFYVVFLVSFVLFGFFSLSHVISSPVNTVIIRSTGQLSARAVTARSGSARDIQAAVDLIIAAGGIGNVFIPEGTFNFVEVGEPWMTVNAPAGVNVFGAPTERTSGNPEPPNGMSPNGQVIEWKTILIMPYSVSENRNYGPYWFAFAGSGDPSRLSRFSDIKLIGYRSFNSTALANSGGVHFDNVVNFRVDHCYFEHIVNHPVGTGFGSSGVIDHSFFMNPVGKVGATLAECTVGYGVGIGRGYGDVWEDDVSKVLGQYTPYTLFVEDCYFEKWRHCLSSNSGGHYVLRHSTIKNDFGYGSIDAHGWGRTDANGNIVQVGTRAAEIYNCQILDAIQYYWATMIRGGAGTAFNNTVGGGTYGYFIYLSNEAQENVSKCWSKDWWIWNNELLGVTEVVVSQTPDKYYPHEGVDYFLHAPHTFDYQPYPYPHPLTLEATQ